LNRETCETGKRDFIFEMDQVSAIWLRRNTTRPCNRLVWGRV
jgi:hypothetical protein